MNTLDKILNCKEAQELEKTLLKNSRAELDAMQNAGAKIAENILSELGNFLGKSPKITVLAGKGHNGGDALCAAKIILSKLPNAELRIFFAAEISELKPNTAFFAKLILSANGSVRIIKKEEISEPCDLLIDGLFGMNFKSPMRKEFAEIIESANECEARFKVSVDIPSGLSDSATELAFKADYTLMTGIAKACLFKPENAKFTGRLRYLDLGFLKNLSEEVNFGIVSERVLVPLKKLRETQNDKRNFGHLFVFGGSANYPGAVLMNVKAAVRAGAGLVTAFVPERFAASFAASEPAAIWVPCPETEDGSLALESFSLYKQKAGKETAILAGSGLGENPETQALIAEIKKSAKAKIILDADAIRSNILQVPSKNEVLITPHLGEFNRISKASADAEILQFCKEQNLSLLLKGALSRIYFENKIAVNCSGGPILSRAGSGDILAGLAGGLLARSDLNLSAFTAAVLASFWAGKAAEFAFAELGESAYANSEVFKYLHKVLL